MYIPLACLKILKNELQKFTYQKYYSVIHLMKVAALSMKSLEKLCCIID